MIGTSVMKELINFAKELPSKMFERVLNTLLQYLEVFSDLFCLIVRCGKVCIFQAKPLSNNPLAFRLLRPKLLWITTSIILAKRSYIFTVVWRCWIMLENSVKDKCFAKIAGKETKIFHFWNVPELVLEIPMMNLYVTIVILFIGNGKKYLHVVL